MRLHSNVSLFGFPTKNEAYSIRTVFEIMLISLHICKAEKCQQKVERDKGSAFIQFKYTAVSTTLNNSFKGDWYKE